MVEKVFKVGKREFDSMEEAESFERQAVIKDYADPRKLPAAELWAVEIMKDQDTFREVLRTLGFKFVRREGRAAETPTADAEAA